MSLMNCPECNKEMSDTIKKCPHCGFVIKKKKVKKEKVETSEKKKLKDKILGVIKNKKFRIGFLVFVVIFFLGCLIISNMQINRVNKVVDFLEDEDYKCEKINSDYEMYDYVCTLEEDGAIYEYLLSYDRSFWDRVLDYDYIGISFTYTDDEYFFRISNQAYIQVRAYADDNTMKNRVNDSRNIVYRVVRNKLDYDKCKTYSRDSYFYDYDDERKCEILNEHYEKYAEIIKDVIEEREDLLDEIGFDLVWREY